MSHALLNPCRISGSGVLQIGDAAVPYLLRRSRRRRTLGLTVTAREVRIHAPNWTPRGEIESYVLQQACWLQRAWARMQASELRPAAEPLQAVSYLGRLLTLDVHPALFSDIRRRGTRLCIFVAPDADAESLVRDWLQQRAGRILAWRLARIGRGQRHAPTRFALSDAQTQWGSCTRSGRIRLNWRLVQAPLALIDYVAAHELAHLVHLDHSPRFWAQVARLCPDALARRAELRALGPALFRL
ncbi:MAG: M48 family metallopeptidase [Gammaproteobacteria bacterium]